MSDPNEKKDPKETPDGMVRKTRRVRKKRKSKGASSEQPDANKLFSKAKELLIGMQDEDEDYGPVDVAEQIRRLKRNKEDDRVLDDVWGTKKKSSTWLWFVLVGVITAIVALVIGLTEWVSEDPGEDEVPNVADKIFTVPPDKLGDGPLGWFHENSVEVLDEVVRIIKKVNIAEEPGEIEGFVRDSPFRSLRAIDLEDWGNNCQTNSLSGFKWDAKVVYSSEESGSKERGFLQVSGTREDGGNYVACFVKEDNRVVLDWDATIGWSEMPVEEIVKEMPRKHSLLRCKVTKRNPSYDQQFDDKEYSGYVLSGAAIDEFFFAYIDLTSERGRAMDRDFRLLLNYQSFVTDEPPLVDQKGTLRVQFDKQIGSEGIFEIVEYLNDGWVSP